MDEYSKYGMTGWASMMSGMDRKTGRKYRRSGKLPSDSKPKERTYRTREDPFTDDWEIVVEMLKEAPALEGKALFEWLLERNPEKYTPGQVRTFQRRLKAWRATEGLPKEVFFGQEHRPGEAMQGDGTWATSLGITINGEPFAHLYYHVVLPYSNWEGVVVCRSESQMAMRRGIQAALFQLGKVPEFFQTDNLSAATHDLTDEEGRAFNEDYRQFIEHFGMKPRKIAVGQSNQDGDVEALNGALKRNLEQHLLLRGSRDFESVESYEQWVQDVVDRTNHLRRKKVAEELAAMRDLKVSRLREYKEEECRVTSGSTIRILHNTYSVPSQLVGEKVKVHVYDDSSFFLRRHDPVGLGLKGVSSGAEAPGFQRRQRYGCPSARS